MKVNDFHLQCSKKLCKKLKLSEKGVPTSIGTRLMEYYRGGIDLSNSEAK